MKLSEQKKEQDIEAARLVALPSAISAPVELTHCPPVQVLQTSVDNMEIAQSFVTLLRW